MVYISQMIQVKKVYLIEGDLVVPTNDWPRTINISTKNALFDFNFVCFQIE